MLENTALFPSTGRSLMELAAIGRSDLIAAAYNNANIGTGTYVAADSAVTNYLVSNSLYVKLTEATTSSDAITLLYAIGSSSSLSSITVKSSGSNAAPFAGLVTSGLLTQEQVDAIAALGSETMQSYAQQAWGQSVPENDVDSAIAEIFAASPAPEAFSAALAAIQGGLFDVKSGS